MFNAWHNKLRMAMGTMCFVVVVEWDRSGSKLTSIKCTCVSTTARKEQACNKETMSVKYKRKKNSNTGRVQEQVEEQVHAQAHKQVHTQVHEHKQAAAAVQLILCPP